MQCPSCRASMQTRSGKFGEFLFCPNQKVCGQSTISVNNQPRYRASDYSVALRDISMGGMASMAYENDIDHHYSRDRGQVDGNDVLFGGGMFCDMGEEDDLDFHPW